MCLKVIASFPYIILTYERFHRSTFGECKKLVVVSWGKYMASMQTGMFNSVQLNRSVMSDSLQPHGLQHARPPGLEFIPEDVVVC